MISAQGLRRESDPPGGMHSPRTLALFLLSLPRGIIKIAIDDGLVERDDRQHIQTRHARGDVRVRRFDALARVCLFLSRSFALAFIFVPRAFLCGLLFLFGRRG